MSTANKCDRCGVLYVPAAGSMYFAEIGIASQSAPDVFDIWTEVDLCPACGVLVSETLAPALDGTHDDEGER